MARIYSDASRVLIWLGGLDENTAREAYHGLDLSIKLYARFRKMEGQADWIMVRQANQALEDPITRSEFDALQSAGGALEILFKNSWFSRAWTFQESFLANARLFYFGSQIFQGQFQHPLSVLDTLASCGQDLNFLPSNRSYVLTFAATKNM